MLRVESTRNLMYAVRHLAPPRPAITQDRRLSRFARFTFGGLVVAVLMHLAVGALPVPLWLASLPIYVWLAFLGFTLPFALWLRARDRGRARRAEGEWESDPRRRAIESLGLDLLAGRLPTALAADDVVALEAASAEWRLVRDAIEPLTYAKDEVARVCARLRDQLDEAMANLLAEAGAGSPIGPSPFLVERARELFAEISAETAALVRLDVGRLHLPTDASLEAVRRSVLRLREARLAREELAMLDQTSLKREDVN